MKANWRTKAALYLPELIGKGYATFWNFRGRWRALKGSRRSKKSKTMALWTIYHMMKHPGANMLVVRKTYRSLKDSCFTELKWAVRRLQVSHLWEFKLSPLEATYLPTGQKIYFRGLDDPLKITSIAVEQGVLCWVWVEEAYEIMSEADFDTMVESIMGDCPPDLWKQITVTFNPWSEATWLKHRFFDELVGWDSNGAPVYEPRKGPISADGSILAITTDYRCNEWLSEEDRQEFERMERENPKRYRVAGLGEWGIADGLVYENWQIREFDPKKLGEEDFTEWQYKSFFGLDYGYTNDPTAFIAFAVNPIKHEMYIYDEFYATKKLNSEIAAMIKEKGYAKERIRADSAEPKSNDDLRRMGISRIQPSVKGKDSIMNGIMAIQEYRIFVHPRCKSTIMELSAYAYKKDRSGRSINEPEDTYNHLMDAMRYAFHDVRFFRPVDPTVQEKAQKGEGCLMAEDMKGEWA